MDNLFRWSAICASLIAGTFASEFLSTRQESPINTVPPHTLVTQRLEMPAKVAFRAVAIERDDALNN